MEFEKEFQAEFFPLDPTKTAVLSLQDQTQYGQEKQLLDKLHPSLRDHIDSMAEGHLDDEHVNTWYKVAHKQWQLMELQHELWQTQPLTFPFSHGGFTSQAPSSAPALASS
ncbi:hypothetical protein C0989_008859 [Termitomyces sp. Mn162]|nr:hypothetical protein C0989_008859 [Termitomyces sp. Mn162]